MIRIFPVMLLFMMLLGGCVHVMSEENLKLVDSSVTYEKLRGNPDAFIGKTVLTGGIIVGVKSSGDVSLLEIAQLELYSNEVPNEHSNSLGRFLALSSALIDPVIYEAGKYITIIGEVKGKKVQLRDGADYPYPFIAAKELHLFFSIC